MPIYLFNIFYVRYCILFGLLLRSLSRMWQKRCCFCIWLGELCCFLFEMQIFQSLQWRQIVQLRKVTLVQIVVWLPWVQSKGYTKEAPMCCKRIYDAPMEMNDTSPTIKISLVSLQKKLSSKMDWRTDSTSGAAAVPLQLHREGLAQSLWKLTILFHFLKKMYSKNQSINNTLTPDLSTVNMEKKS